MVCLVPTNVHENICLVLKIKSVKHFEFDFNLPLICFKVFFFPLMACIVERVDGEKKKKLNWKYTGGC